MKDFLSSHKGKLIVCVLAIICVVGVVAIILITLPKDYRSIKVDGLSGTTIITNESNLSENAYKGMHLESGDNVSVEADSNMTLLFDADKYMFADEGTKFRVEASGSSDKANTKTKIILEEGSVLCRLDSKLNEDEVYEVETPNSTMSVRGTIFRMAIYQDESGENYTKLDVLEGSVKVNLHMEDGQKTDEEEMVEAGQAATVHSNSEISEFVIGESTISYEDYTEPMSQFIIDTIDSGREIYIEKDLFIHYTESDIHTTIETVIKEASCSEEGKKEIYCSICDEIVHVENIEKLEHMPGEWIEKSEGTCIEKATEVLTCLVCGEDIETKELELGEHSYSDWTISKEGTCINQGKESSTCEFCGDIKTRVIEPTGHEFGEWEVTAEVSCTTKGETTRICGKCGEVEKKENIFAEHKYGKWSISKAATCTTEGEEVRTCSECGNNEKQVIAALGHTFGEWVMQLQPTCITDGENMRFCNLCGEVEIEAITGGSGHSFQQHTSSVNHWWMPLASDPTGRILDYVVAEVSCTTCKNYGDYQEYYLHQILPLETKYDDASGNLIYYKCTCGFEYHQ